MSTRSNPVLLLSLSFFATAAQDLLLGTIRFSSLGIVEISAVVQLILGVLALVYWLLVTPDYRGMRPLGVTLLAIENVAVGLALEPDI